MYKIFTEINIGLENYLLKHLFFKKEITYKMIVVKRPKNSKKIRNDKTY
jgi:hypothetical protein